MVFKNGFRLVKLFVLWFVLAGTLLVATASAAVPNGVPAAVNYFWHTFYGSSAWEYDAGIATDTNGNVYILGTSDAAWQGDNDTNPKHPYNVQSNIFILKLNSEGTYQWHTFYGSAEGNQAGAIAVDAAGNVYVTGGSGQQWLGDGDAQPLHKVGSGFVLKLNTNGVYKWHTFYKMGTGPVAVDGEGNLLIAGNSDATWKGDGGAKPLHAFTGPGDITVLKLSSAGQYLWHTFYGPAGAAGIAVGKDKNVYVSGNTSESWVGDGNKVPLHAYTGDQDLVVLALTGQGGYRWHTFYGSATGDGASNPAVDKQNNIFVTGASADTWLGGGDTAPLAAHQGSSDTLLLKLKSTGVYVWHTFYGSDDADGGQHLALDQNGAPHVTQDHNYMYSGDWCPTVMPLCQYWFTDVAEFSTAGGYQRSVGTSQVGDPGEFERWARGIATDHENNTYALGDFSNCQGGCINPNPLHAYTGGADALIVKLNLAEPPPPALVKPVNKAVVVLKSPTLDWDDAVNATSYHFELRQGSKSGTVIADTDLTVSTFKTPVLTRGARYFWRVEACGENGCSAPTAWWKFTVRPK